MKKLLFLLASLTCIGCSTANETATTYKAKVYYHLKTIEPYLCLTFDDGPDKFQTPKVLEILDKYKIKATFFVIGEEIEYQKDILKLVADKGHDIGNHFYTHINPNKYSEKEIYKSIYKNNELIYQVTGKRPKYVRPPYGIVNDKVKEACSALNMDIILWTDDKDSRDWDKAKESTIVNNLTKHVTNGDIFLFHDSDKSMKNTLSAVDIIIPELTKKGYKWVTISKLLS